VCAQNFDSVRLQNWNLKLLRKPDQKFAHTMRLQLLRHMNYKDRYSTKVSAKQRNYRSSRPQKVRSDTLSRLVGFDQGLSWAYQPWYSIFLSQQTSTGQTYQPRKQPANSLKVTRPRAQ